MLLKKVKRQNIGTFLGYLKRNVDSDATWEKKESRSGKSVYRISLPAFETVILAEPFESGTVVSIPAVTVMYKIAKTRELESRLMAYERGTKQA